MKKKKRCTHCQQIIKQPYMIKLKQPMVRILNFYKKIEDEKELIVYAIHYKDERFQDIKRVSTGILSDMKKFGLVQRCMKPGWWSITDKGKDFLAGKIDMPIWIDVLDNKAINCSEVRVYIDKVPP